MKTSIFVLILMVFAVSCGENGGDAPGGGSTEATCAGTVVGGHCWYFGTDGESCTEVCASHGGYKEATRTYAGSDGTRANCEEVIGTLYGSATAFDRPCGAGLGCSEDAGVIQRCFSPATTANAFDPSIARFCACNE